MFVLIGDFFYTIFDLRVILSDFCEICRTKCEQTDTAKLRFNFLSDKFFPYFL